jgi:hypothetical protein
LPPTELVLPRSTYTGTPAKFSTNREYLARALRMGLSKGEVTDADTALACRDRNHVYVWQPLSSESVIEATNDMTRIEPVFPDPRPARRSETHQKGESPLHAKSTPAAPASRRDGDPNEGTGPADGSTLGGPGKPSSCTTRSRTPGHAPVG